MGNSDALGLIALPIAMAVFLTLLNESLGPTLLIFTSVASFIIAVSVSAITSVVGAVEIFGSGVDMKDWSLNFVFVTTYLAAFYGTNVVAGLGLILSVPFGIGIVVLGVLSSMFVFGMVQYISGGGK